MSTAPAPSLRVESFEDLNRLLRERPLCALEASIERDTIERQNRAVRDRLRARRGPVVFSTLD